MVRWRVPVGVLAGDSDCYIIVRRRGDYRDRSLFVLRWVGCRSGIVPRLRRRLRKDRLDEVLLTMAFYSPAAPEKNVSFCASCRLGLSVFVRVHRFCVPLLRLRVCCLRKWFRLRFGRYWLVGLECVESRCRSVLFGGNCCSLPFVFDVPYCVLVVCCR